MEVTRSEEINNLKVKLEDLNDDTQRTKTSQKQFDSVVSD